MGNIVFSEKDKIDDDVYLYQPNDSEKKIHPKLEQIHLSHHLGLAEKVFCAEKSQSRRERRRYNKSKYKVHPLAPRE